MTPIKFEQMNLIPSVDKPLNKGAFLPNRHKRFPRFGKKDKQAMLNNVEAPYISLNNDFFELLTDVV